MNVKKAITQKIDNRDKDTLQIDIITNAEAETKKHWKKNQLAIILDRTFTIHTLTGYLPVNLTEVTSTELNKTNERINKLTQILEEFGLAVIE